MPKNPKEVDNLYCQICQLNGHWIIIYGIDTETEYQSLVRLSFISFDYNNGTYELIGNYYEFYPFLYGVFGKSDIFNSTLITKFGNFRPGFKIYVFNVDTKLLTFELQRSIDASSFRFYFHLIDEQIIFAKSKNTDGNPRIIIEDFMVINRDYSLTKIENTAVCIGIDYSYSFDCLEGETKVD